MVIPASMITTDANGYTTLNTASPTFVDVTTTGNTTLGNASSDTLTVNATVAADMLFDTTKKAIFRAAGTAISSADAGHLDVDADTSIDLNSPLINVASGGTIAGVATGANGLVIKNPKNSAASELSGTQLDVQIDIDGTPYYFTVYPTKA